MGHPVLSSIKNLLYYSGIWVLILILSTLLTYSDSGFPIYISLLVCIIYDGSFAVLGIGLWYNIRYKNFEEIKPFNRIINHILEALVISFLWTAICYFFIITVIFEKDPKSIEISYNALPITFIFGIVFFALITLFYYLVLSYRNLQEKIKNESTLQSLIQEAELSLLKSQINPHFLFNSLNSISSLTISNPAKAREMIIKLSDFLRHSIGHKEQQLTTLHEEIEHIKVYLEIEKIRFGDRLQYDFVVNADCSQFQIPVMLFQPLFENAVKHGVYESIEPITIHFNCIPLSKGLLVKISNNFEPEAPPRKGNKMGIKNVENRLKLIYHSDNLMKINRCENTFEVELFIPKYISE
ncbi:MAG TPA: histidine kinase [Bacteroidales bacterium]|nr:histidine kinase [Bacteroidales bacterium]